MVKEIKFSVLVPVYNARHYLDACIQSVMDQSYNNYELILVNDGSTDGSAAICDRYAESSTKIFAYHKENRGQLHTREYAVSKATGDYCVFLDADDTLRIDALATIRSAIEKFDSDCVVYRLVRVCEGKTLSQVEPMQDYCIEDKRELYRKCFLTSIYNSMCLKATKRTLFTGEEDYSAYYGVRLGEDLLQSLEVLKNSRRVAFIGDVLYNYTINPNSMIQGLDCKRYKPDFVVYEKVLELLRSENVFNQQDFADYHTWGIRLCIGEIERVCNSKNPWKEKVQALKKIRNESFYREYLLKERTDWRRVGKHGVVFRMHKNKLDGLCAFVLPLWWKLHAFVRNA